MKTSQEILNNLQTMDEALANIQGQVFLIVAARKENINALDDDMTETWSNFRTEMQKLQEEVKQVIECISFEDGNQ